MTRISASAALVREHLALNVYVAMCYYKLDYYDVSQEVLAVYLQHFPDSAIAINLRACNHFRLYNGKAAEQVSPACLQPLPPVQRQGRRTGESRCCCGLRDAPGEGTAADAG